MQLCAQVAELPIAVGHDRLLRAQSVLRGRKLRLACQNLRLHGSELSLRGDDSELEIRKALFAYQVANVGEQD